MTKFLAVLLLVGVATSAIAEPRFCRQHAGFVRWTGTIATRHGSRPVTCCMRNAIVATPNAPFNPHDAFTNLSGLCWPGLKRGWWLFPEGGRVCRRLRSGFGYPVGRPCCQIGILSLTMSAPAPPNGEMRAIAVTGDLACHNVVVPFTLQEAP